MPAAGGGGPPSFPEEGRGSFGRISGPLLKDNLLRNGTDLAFETSLLYLNVTGKYVGINTQGPSSDLTIGTVKNNGASTTSTIRTTNLIVPTTSTIGNFIIGTNTIQHLTSSINVTPNPSSNPTSVTPGLSTSNLYLYGNTVSNTVTNASTNISPNGTGEIYLANGAGNVEVTVNAGLHATGNITWDGDITLGNASTDDITFAAKVNSNLLPQVLSSLVTPISEQLLAETLEVFITEDSQNLFTDPAAPYYATTYLYNLGSNSLKWNNIYANTLSSVSSGVTSAISATNINIGNFYLTGNTIANSNNDSIFAPTGTGEVKFNNWKYINGSNIVNPTTLPWNIASTGNGHVKFNGAGFVMPVGTTSGTLDGQPKNPELGTARWNTDVQYIEIYDGTIWIPAYGTASNATTTDVDDYSTLYSIVFGY
jgi:hypothetical protein